MRNLRLQSIKSVCRLDGVDGTIHYFSQCPATRVYYLASEKGLYSIEEVSWYWLACEGIS